MSSLYFRQSTSCNFLIMFSIMKCFYQFQIEVLYFFVHFVLNLLRVMRSFLNMFLLSKRLCHYILLYSFQSIFVFQLNEYLVSTYFPLNRLLLNIIKYFTLLLIKTVLLFLRTSERIKYSEASILWNKILVLLIRNIDNWSATRLPKNSNIHSLGNIWIA